MLRLVVLSFFNYVSESAKNPFTVFTTAEINDTKAEREDINQ